MESRCSGVFVPRLVVDGTAWSADQAQRIAHVVVSNNFAACVNMHPISSVYVWNGKVKEDSEIAMFVKTTSG